MTSTSPLELLHPAGRVERRLALGDSCPPALLPAAASNAAADADLVLIAPSAAQLGQHGWLEAAVGEAARALSRDGFVYALVPRRNRPAARRRLRQCGLVLETPIVQIPGGGVPRYLLPLQAEPWRHALTQQVGARPWARRALLATRALPFGSALLARALPTVGIVARHPGAEPLAAWVGQVGGSARQTAYAVVGTSWRGPHGATVLRCFAPAEAQPWGVAKVAPGSAAEARALDELGDAARTAGARVPRLLASGRVASRPVLVETFVSGRPAADVLMRSPRRFAEVTEAITKWQARWNLETAASRARFEDEVVGPAAELEGKLPDGYRSWLLARCHALAGSEPPLVARHNDLTMWNVLLDEQGTIGVIDWAEADGAGLPLTDFFYAVADAAAACDGSHDRLAAVRSCFVPGGPRADAVATLQERLRDTLKLGPDAVEVSFHACWLRHARNEQQSEKTSDGQFLAIAQWVARRALGETL